MNTKKIEDFRFYRVAPNSKGFVTLILPKREDTSAFVAKLAEKMKVEEIEGTQEMFSDAVFV